MKNKLYLILAGLFLLTVQVKAQSPGSFNYQGVARDAAGAVLATQTIGLEFTVHQGSAGGTVVYEETQSATTNQFGLFTVAIGTGTVVTGTFAGIDWGANSEYLDVAMDPTGSGSPYTDMGTQQLLSVPYALYAANSGNAYTAGTGIGITSNVISANTTDALWNANKLEGDSVSITAPTSGQVLQWNGTAWAPATASDWGLTGNSGTTYGTDFVGTNDDQGLMFKVNGTTAGRIEENNISNNLYANTALGDSSMINNVTGNAIVAIGYGTLPTNQTGSDITAIGSGADVIYDGITNSTAIGANAIVQGNNTVQLGSGCSVQFDQALMPGGDPGSAGEFLVSNGAGVAPSWNLPTGWSLTGNYGTTYGTDYIGTDDAAGLQFEVNGEEAGRIEFGNNFFGPSENANTALGYEALPNDAGSDNVAIGYKADNSIGGNGNTGVGDEALGQSGGNNNTGIGYSAALQNGGSNNTGVGANSDYVNYGGGNDNTAVGYNAMYVNYGAGSQNTIIGANAWYEQGNGNATTSYNTVVGANSYSGGGGSNNTGLGYQSINGNSSGSNNTGVGYNVLSSNSTGNNITAIGYNANVSVDGLSDATAIGENAVVGESNALVLGGTGSDAVNVGINTSTPNSSLQISGGNVSLPVIVSASSVDLSTSPLTFTVIITATGQTVTLPSAASCTGRIYFIVAQMASGSVTISSFLNFSGAGTTTLLAQGSITIQSDGTNWDQIK